MRSMSKQNLINDQLFPMVYYYGIVLHLCSKVFI